MTSLAWQLTSLLGAIVLAAVGGELFLKGVLEVIATDVF